VGARNISVSTRPRRIVPSHDATQELAEVAAVYVVIEAAVWTLGMQQLILGIAATAAMAVLTIRSHRSARELGLTTAGLRRSWWIVAVALMIGGIGLLASFYARTLHILHGARAPVWHALLYACWALVQQFIIESFIFVRLETVFGTTVAIIATTVMFSLAHVPNAVLVTATAIMGLGFAWLFSRYRNIYPLAIAHAVLGITLAITLPENTTHFMRVGAAMFMKKPY
jgi:membrane protease YdiL (CAAX protease family)